jgi:hypothetical protein
METLGEPQIRERTTIGAVRAKDLKDDRLQGLLSRGDEATQTDYVVWEASCWFRQPDRFIGLFDPESGQILLVGGEALYASWTVVH